MCLPLPSLPPPPSLHVLHFLHHRLYLWLCVRPWDQYDQTSFRTPGAIKAGLLNNTAWARHGAPSEYTDLHAYDRTSYNKQNSSALPGIDVRINHHYNSSL